MPRPQDGPRGWRLWPCQKELNRMNQAAALPVAAWRETRASKARGPFVCGCCGVSYVTTRQKGEGEKYCSRECAYTARASVRVRFCTVAFNACRVCGKRWTAERAKPFCSCECRRRDACRRKREAAMQAHAGKTCRCQCCGQSFAPEYGSKRRAFCSDACVKRHTQRTKQRGNNAQRAKRAGNAYSYFNELRIFRRDKWTCQLCGVPTPERKRGTYADDAPELDHIVSLAHGGAHTPENTQCACRKCNSAKGAASRGQLWLAGFADVPTQRRQAVSGKRHTV